MKEFLTYKHNWFEVLDFVLNRSFTNWVKREDRKGDQNWSELLVNNPDIVEKTETARKVALALQFTGERMSSENINNEWEKLLGTLNAKSTTPADNFNTADQSSRKSLLSILAVFAFAVIVISLASSFLTDLSSSHTLSWKHTINDRSTDRCYEVLLQTYKSKKVVFYSVERIQNRKFNLYKSIIMKSLINTS